ncbi:MAG: porin family protein [Chitinophagales bacterium]
MKRVVLTLNILFTVAIISAQTMDSASTTITTIEEEDDPSRDRIIMNVHWDGWLGAEDPLKVKGLSSGLGIHVFYDIPLGTEYVSFAIGAGLSWSNYYNNSYFTYDTAQNTIPVAFDDSVAYKKNKLVINYIEVPLEFRFRTKENGSGNRFKAAIGFKGGYVLTNHTKFVGDDWLSGSDDEIKYKQYRVKNMTTLQYGPTIRLGYSKINLEAYYGLAPLFVDGKGPAGNPITVSLSFNPF